MPFHPCVSGCGRYLATGDGHDCCLTCLGKHAEVAFVDESSSLCGKMTISELRTRLCFLQKRGRSPVAAAAIWGSFWRPTDENHFQQ